MTRLANTRRFLKRSHILIKGCQLSPCEFERVEQWRSTPIIESSRLCETEVEWMAAIIPDYNDKRSHTEIYTSDSESSLSFAKPFSSDDYFSKADW